MLDSFLNPNECAICFNEFSNNRCPLILSKCGHTYCEICLDKILDKLKKEIICPECKLVSSNINGNLNTFLLKNRSLMNIKNKKQEEINTNINQIKKENDIGLSDKYNKLISKIEKTYDDILKKNTFLKEDNRPKAIEKINTVLDDYIKIINSYRRKLHQKINVEYDKIDSIKEYKYTINHLKKKSNFHSTLIQSEKINVGNHDDNFDLAHPSTWLERLEKSFLKVKDIFLQKNENGKQKIIQSEINLAESFLKEINSREIYDPYQNLFINQFQSKKLINELEKILHKSCDFDNKINKYKINQFNKNNLDNLEKEIMDCCKSSNIEKIKAIFQYFSLNPNFYRKEKNVDNQSIKIPIKNIKGVYEPVQNYNILNSYLCFIENEKRKSLIQYLIDECYYIPHDYGTFYILNLQNPDVSLYSFSSLY
jgi:hypothetical protein